MFKSLLISLIGLFFLNYKAVAQIKNDSATRINSTPIYKNEVGVRLPAAGAGSEFSLVYKRFLIKALALEANIGTLSYTKFYNATFLLSGHLYLHQLKRLKLIYGGGGTLIYIRPEYMYLTRYYQGKNGPGKTYSGLTLSIGPEYHFKNSRFLIGLDARKTYFNFVDYETGIRYKYNNIAVVIKYII